MFDDPRREPHSDAGRDAHGWLKALGGTRTVAELGRVVHAGGTVLRVTGLQARIGQTCQVLEPGGAPALLAEVVAFSGREAILAPLGELQGLAVGAAVQVVGQVASMPCGPALLGRVVDAFGRPCDGGPGLPPGGPTAPLYRPAPDPMRRRLIDTALDTGVRAIDAAVTVAQGQRVGVFATAGGGKSTLMGMLARQAQVDVIVIGLIGERGREVREFIEDSLGAHGLARAVVVVATSDRPALERVRAAYAATAVAEAWRDRGAQVLLLMDSVTRFARGLREVGLAAGEPPVRRGYPPSVFAELPRLFERAGQDAQGAITAFYTVLIEDEDEADPVGEEVRSILDGHLVLSRALARAGQYPAIDLLASASRVFGRVTSPAHAERATRLRALLARHAEVEFLVRVGEYQPGSDPLADEAIARMPALRAWLSQRPDQPAPRDATLAELAELVA